ncbi:MAG: isochorismate synthase [Melioribacteraceae bacterium]|nr:isochorismate synthase [Melioribacteraceae bacterium]
MSLISTFLQNENIDKHSLSSFFYRIEPINFLNLIESISDFRNVLTFFNERKNFSFVAIDEVKTDVDVFTSSLNINTNVDENILEKFPQFVGYKKFNDNSKSNLWNDFADNKWYIPKFLIVRDNNDYYIIHNFRDNEYDENSFNYLISLSSKLIETSTTEIKVDDLSLTRDSKSWTSNVELALKRINENTLDKVVLARKIEIQLKSQFSLSFVINKLLNACDDCIVFSVKENNSIFWGATPEKLFSINKNILHTEALAGSIERSSDKTEDAFLGNQLLRDPKELNEQKKVLDYILSILENFSSDIKFNEIPFIKKLNTVQHLQTKITATINEKFDIFKFLEEIHPTPAVCGYPKDVSMKFILETENFDRGLYAGVIGWFNKFNVGEFYVGIRSALLKENKLNVFAGCGIVEGSIPEKEFQETEIKMKPILSVLSL